MSLALLIDAAEFWPALRDDLARARHRALVQVLTFEADGAGRPLADALLACGARERVVLVDHFNRFMHNDRFVLGLGGLADRALRAEVRATRAMLAELAAAGVAVRHTNPVGPLLVRFAARNHKKILVVDDVAYVGGMNFSDHNFAWHDMMLRIEDRAVADFLAGDVAATFAGHDVPARHDGAGLTIESLDGHGNAAALDAVAARVAAAEGEVFAESPYVTFPFVEAFGAARARGAEVRLVTPATNNWAAMGDYIAWHAAEHGLALHGYPRMTHLKAILLDDALVMGSTNFDYLSYRLHQELVVTVTDRAVVDDFRRRVAAADLAIAPRLERVVSARRGRRCMAQIARLGRLSAALRGAPRRPPAQSISESVPSSDVSHQAAD